MDRTSLFSRPRRRWFAVIPIVVAALVIPILPAPAQELPQADVAETGEMLPNGGFDAADLFGTPVGWSVSGSSATVVYLQAARTAGPGSLEVKNVAGSPVTVTGRREVATAGFTYTLTGQAKVTAGTGATVLMRFYDFNKTTLHEVSWNVTSGAFSPFSLAGQAPANTALVMVLISGTTASAGTSYFDELSLRSSMTAYNSALGSNHELFLDDYRIESANDVQRVVHPGAKSALPVIKADKPWEKSAYTYGSAFLINGTYKLFYACYNDVAPNYYTCYAESTDGISWTKLNLGLYNWNGSTANNIVTAPFGTVAYNPNAPSSQRYAQLYFKQGVVNQTMGYYGRFSADGLHWTEINANQPLLLDGDVSNVTYDQLSGKYIATIKKRMFTADTSSYERAAFVSTSTDFLNWSTPQLGVMGDSADDGGAYARGGLESQIYGMPVIPYQGVYIGVPWVFDILNFTSGEFKTAADGPLVPQIAVSRDLLSWSRPVRNPLIELGQGGAWDDGSIYTASNVIVTSNSVIMYYGGFNTGHGGAEPSNPDRNNQVGNIGKVTWRLDGFVSLTNASTPGLGDPGHVTTKPITFTGNQLRLNSNVRAGGSIVVAVLNSSGQMISGFGQSNPVTGDSLSSVVTFPGGATLATLSGQQVKFQFTIVNADLYSYWVQ